MPYKVTYGADGEPMKLHLSNPQVTRVKVLMVISAGGGILFLLFALKLLGELFSRADISYAVLIFLLVVGFISMRFARGYLIAVSSREEVEVDENILVIVKRNIFGSKRLEYDLARISDFRVLGGKRVYIAHDISTPSVDYAGTNMRIREAEAVSTDDRLSFFYEGRNITFGNKLLETEGEEIRELIINFSGRTLLEDEETLRWKSSMHPGF